MKGPVFRLFQFLSRVARATPLRQISWVNSVHDRAHALLGPAPPFQVGPFEVDVDPRDRLLCKKLSLYGEYEPFQTRLILDLLNPGDSFVDVGANVGLYTLWASRRVGPAGRVVAFEPDPDNLRILRRNLDRNDCVNVDVVAAAASDKVGVEKLYQNERNRGNLSLSGHGGRQCYVPVQTVTLDEQLSEQSDLAVIKIDVEGAEALVLDGARETLRRNPDCAIMLEMAPPLLSGFGFRPQDVVQRLVDFGFEIHIIDEDKEAIRPCHPESISREARAGRIRNLLCRRG